jgi:hypothetical protein
MDTLALSFENKYAFNYINHINADPAPSPVLTNL